MARDRRRDDGAGTSHVVSALRTAQMPPNLAGVRQITVAGSGGSGSPLPPCAYCSREAALQEYDVGARVSCKATFDNQYRKSR